MRFCYFAHSFSRGNKLMIAFSGQYHGADAIPAPMLSEWSYIPVSNCSLFILKFAWCRIFPKKIRIRLSRCSSQGMEFWTVCLPHAEFPALIFDSVRVPGWQTVYHACLSTARAAPDDPPMNDVTGSKNQASVHLPSIQNLHVPETVHDATSHTLVLLEQTNMLPQSPNDSAAELTIRAWKRSWHHFSADCFLTKDGPGLGESHGDPAEFPKESGLRLCSRHFHQPQLIIRGSPVTVESPCYTRSKISAGGSPTVQVDLGCRIMPRIAKWLTLATHKWNRPRKKGDLRSPGLFTT